MLVTGEPLALLEEHSKQAALSEGTAFLREHPGLLSVMDQLMLPLLHRVYSAQVDTGIRSVVRAFTPSISSCNLVLLSTLGIAVAAHLVQQCLAL